MQVHPEDMVVEVILWKVRPEIYVSSMFNMNNNLFTGLPDRQSMFSSIKKISQVLKKWIYIIHANFGFWWHFISKKIYINFYYLVRLLLLHNLQWLLFLMNFDTNSTKSLKYFATENRITFMFYVVNSSTHRVVEPIEFIKKVGVTLDLKIV